MMRAQTGKVVMKYFIQELEHMANCETGEDESRIMAEVSDIKDAFQICGALNFYKNEGFFTEYFVVDAEGNEADRPPKPVYTSPPEDDDIPF